MRRGLGGDDPGFIQLARSPRSSFERFEGFEGHQQGQVRSDTTRRANQSAIRIGSELSPSGKVDMSERVQRYRQAVATLDFDALGEMRHPDFVCYYPQSGERFIGHENWAQAHRDYVSHFKAPAPQTTSVKGGDQKARVIRTATPRFALGTPVVQISDTGDLVTLEGTDEWPDGKTYNWVSILEYREGLVWRETQYFAEPFDPPEWRAQFVELDAEAAPADTTPG